MAEAFARIEERTDRRLANFMALFANANSGKGRSFKAEDFMPARARPKQVLNEKEIFERFDAIFANSETVTEERNKDGGNDNGQVSDGSVLQ